MLHIKKVLKPLCVPKSKLWNIKVRNNNLVIVPMLVWGNLLPPIECPSPLFPYARPTSLIISSPLTLRIKMCSEDSEAPQVSMDNFAVYIIHSNACNCLFSICSIVIILHSFLKPLKLYIRYFLLNIIHAY